MENMKRDQATPKDIEAAAQLVYDAVIQRSRSEGLGIMASFQEVLGAIRVETGRLEQVTMGTAFDQKVVEEYLKRIAVTAIFGIVSVRNGRLKW